MSIEMRLLEDLAGQADLCDEALRNTIVLHINHCMDNSFEFSRILGSLFRTVIFVGAPYNENIPPEDPSFIGYSAVESEEGTYTIYRNCRKDETFQGYFSDCVHKLIRIAFEKDILPSLLNGNRLLIFEDGGYHYDVVRELVEDYPQIRNKILGVVEQTTSGTVKGRRSGTKEAYSYPQLSVARSAVKMNIESIFIAERVIEELALYLYSINTFLDFHHILLIGYGVIGRKIAETLAVRNVDIQVYDTEPAIREVACEDGYKAPEIITPETFSSDTIVIGNTGCASFSEEMLSAFFEGDAEKIYLVSSSSQEEEFIIFLSMLRGDRSFPEGIVLREQTSFEGTDVYQFLFTDTDGKQKKKEIYLIAKGRPVNFFRQDVISLTNCVIDLVFSEMFYLGIWLCNHPDMEKKLHLLGKDSAFSGETHEKELFKKWLSIYHLSEQAGMAAFSNRHPAADLLREMLV